MKLNKTKYKIVETTICPFYSDGYKGFFDTNYFEDTRLCVIDSNKSFVIDVLHGLKYSYVKTINGIYLVPGEFEKLQNEKRYAIRSNVPLALTKKDKKRSKAIISLLDEGYEFPDGNKVLGNYEYHSEIELEKSERKVLKIKR